jgi:hypothetical protein
MLLCTITTTLSKYYGFPDAAMHNHYQQDPNQGHQTADLVLLTSTCMVTCIVNGSPLMHHAMVQSTAAL